MSRYEDARDFIRARLSQNDTRPALRAAVERCVDRAEQCRRQTDTPDYWQGYVHAVEDSVISLAAIWRHHPDFDVEWGTW